MTWRVSLSDLDYGAEELNAVHEVLSRKWLTMGEVTERFERAFADYLGVRQAIAVSNATAGLHLANLALGIGPGDEVIVPSLTFVATANAVKYTGASPVFADVASTQDFGISLEAIRLAITAKTKAIIVMHYGGYMCDMPSIIALAQEHGLAVVEDAAHAPGAVTGEKKAGTWGDVACFSFFSNKNLVTGEGGMVVTNREDLAERIRSMRSHGMTSLSWDRHRGEADSYDVVTLGYNYRIDEIRSALGLVQLVKLEANNKKRRKLVDCYRDELRDVDGLSLPYSKYSGVPAAHIFPVLLNSNADRRAFRERLHALGIQTSVHYPPVHRFTYYRQFVNGATLPITEDVGSREVTLPLYPTINQEQLELVVDAVKRGLDAAAP